MPEFRWQVWRCRSGHVVALGEMFYVPGEEPVTAEPDVPDYCPKCGAPVNGKPELALRDQVSPVQVPIVARFAG